MGVMHCDISPRNLLVFSYWTTTSAHAGICDFGKAKKGARGVQASLEPPAFTAPEVGQYEAGYTNAIDIFSLGLSILATFSQWECTGPMSRDNYAKVLVYLASLQDCIPEGLSTLIRAMVAWDPVSRPTVEEALAESLWAYVDTVERDNDDCSQSS